MDERVVDSYFKGYKEYKGTFPRDKIPNTRARPAYFVINTDSKYEPGEHWVTIVLLENKKGLYFNPFGFPPLHEDLQKFMNTKCCNGFEFSCQPLQHIDSTNCGLFCIAFIKLHIAGFSYSDILCKFCTRLKHNDQLLQFVKRI